jgi:hypothetical protein
MIDSANGSRHEAPAGPTGSRPSTRPHYPPIRNGPVSRHETRPPGPRGAGAKPQTSRSRVVIPEGAGPVNCGVGLGFLVVVPWGGEFGALKKPAVGPGGSRLAGSRVGGVILLVGVGTVVLLQSRADAGWAARVGVPVIPSPPSRGHGVVRPQPRGLNQVVDLAWMGVMTTNELASRVCPNRFTPPPRGSGCDRLGVRRRPG